MIKTSPQPPENDSAILFYPVDSEQLSPGIGNILITLAVPFVLLFAFILAPALFFWIPIVLLNHWINKTPLDFNIDRATAHFERILENGKADRQPQRFRPR